MQKGEKKEDVSWGCLLSSNERTGLNKGVSLSPWDAGWVGAARVVLKKGKFHPSSFKKGPFGEGTSHGSEGHEVDNGAKSRWEL